MWSAGRLMLLTVLAGLGLIALASTIPQVAAEDKADKVKVIQPFNGLDLKGWKFKGEASKSKWVVGRATLDEKDPAKLAVTPIAPQADGGPAARLLINAAASVDLYTEEKFGDCAVEVRLHQVAHGIKLQPDRLNMVRHSGHRTGDRTEKRARRGGDRCCGERRFDKSASLHGVYTLLWPSENAASIQKNRAALSEKSAARLASGRRRRRLPGTLTRSRAADRTA